MHPQLPGKMQHVVCTGNLCGAEEAAWLKSLAPRMTLVRGDFDDDDSVPETAVTTVGAFRIGVCHGHTVVPWGDVEALAAMARRLDCDILVTGHTHVQSVVEVGGRLLVNPGSMTGEIPGASVVLRLAPCPNKPEMTLNTAVGRLSCA